MYGTVRQGELVELENCCCNGEGEIGAWYEKVEEPVRTEDGEVGDR
jgi:hypothetical protein